MIRVRTNAPNIAYIGLRVAHKDNRAYTADSFVYHCATKISTYKILINFYAMEGKVLCSHIGKPEAYTRKRKPPHEA